MARSWYRQEFLDSSVANKRKQVPYPPELSELPPFVEWFPMAISQHEFEDPDEEVLLHLFSIPPSPIARSHNSCIAYGNH